MCDKYSMYASYSNPTPDDEDLPSTERTGARLGFANTPLPGALLAARCPVSRVQKESASPDTGRGRSKPSPGPQKPGGQRSDRRDVEPEAHGRCRDRRLQHLFLPAAGCRPPSRAAAEVKRNRSWPI